MKIFQIGFNRCGTTSIYHFFNSKCENKPRCLHWQEGDLALKMFINLKNKKPILEGPYENFDVYTDMQAFIRSSEGEALLFLAHMDCYKLLDEQYPGSKFILNTRNVYNWVASRIRHYRSYKQDYMALMESIYKTNNVLDVWMKQWVEHHDDVVNYFKGRDDLLILDIERDSGQKIVNFFPELKFSDNILPKMN